MDELKYIVGELYANTKKYFMQKNTGMNTDVAAKLGIK